MPSGDSLDYPMLKTFKSRCIRSHRKKFGGNRATETDFRADSSWRSCLKGMIPLCFLSKSIPYVVNSSANPSVLENLNANPSVLENLNANPSVLENLNANPSVLDNLNANPSVLENLNANP